MTMPASAARPIPFEAPLEGRPGKPVDQLDDRSLAELAKEGSVPAYNVLVVRYQDRVYRFLLRRTGSSAEAEDIAQETFLRAWQKLHTFEPERPLAPWLLTIAARLAASAARRRARIRVAPESSLGYVDAAAPCLLPANPDAGHDRKRIWRIAESVLNRDQLTAVWLRYVEGLSPAQIARVMDKSGVAVRVMLLRARNVLGEAIRDRAEDIIQPDGPSDSGESRTDLGFSDSAKCRVTQGMNRANTPQE
ncbi:MAG: RNA polymerase sigma factor [Phycisphaerales bacterium]|nr:RNA polymerase sigma factor [Phycisphaerales bacterium]